MAVLAIGHSSLHRESKTYPEVLVAVVVDGRTIGQGIAHFRPWPLEGRRRADMDAIAGGKQEVSAIIVFPEARIMGPAVAVAGARVGVGVDQRQGQGQCSQK